MSRVWFLCVRWHDQLYALHFWLLLQCDGSVGRIGWLQRWLLLSDGLDVSDAAAVPDPFVLPGAEPEHDGLADTILLPVERHERAHCVRRGCVL